MYHEEDYDSVDIINVDIEVNNYVVYDCKVEVKIYRGLPCEAALLGMERLVFDYDNTGDMVDNLELCPSEFPTYIQNAAEKKAVEGY